MLNSQIREQLVFVAFYANILLIVFLGIKVVGRAHMDAAASQAASAPLRQSNAPAIALMSVITLQLWLAIMIIRNALTPDMPRAGSPVIVDDESETIEIHEDSVSRDVEP